MLNGCNLHTSASFPTMTHNTALPTQSKYLSYIQLSSGSAWTYNCKHCITHQHLTDQQHNKSHEMFIQQLICNWNYLSSAHLVLVTNSQLFDAVTSTGKPKFCLDLFHWQCFLQTLTQTGSLVDLKIMVSHSKGSRQPPIWKSVDIIFCNILSTYSNIILCLVSLDWFEFSYYVLQ